MGRTGSFDPSNFRTEYDLDTFLKKHFNDPDKLVVPIELANIDINEEEMKKLFKYRKYKDNYKILSAEVRKLNENIPPLINAYMNLSPTMRTFGTFINHHFGGVEETGIMITLKDIYIEKINRHMASYDNNFAITWFTRGTDKLVNDPEEVNFGAM